MKRVTASITLCYSIHDSWSETLTGTHFLLRLLSSSEDSPDNIEWEHLARLVIVSCHHLIEIIFFDTVEKYINANKSSIKTEILQEIKAKKDDRIGIREAMKEWPVLLLGNSNSFDFSREPFQSQEMLRKKRNDVIHYKATSSTSALASSAYYTAIMVSKAINSKFFPNKEFHYDGFVNKPPPVLKEYFLKTFNKEIQYG